MSIGPNGTGDNRPRESLVSSGARQSAVSSFLAFSMSMALSPADTAVLSRWAEGLVMIQAMVSLTVVVVVAARAVNVL